MSTESPSEYVVLSEALTLWLETFSANTSHDLEIVAMQESADKRSAIITLGATANEPVVTYHIEPLHTNGVEAKVTITSEAEIVKGEIHSPATPQSAPVFVSYQ